ncbi:MAG: UMP kinase [Halobacteriales archaeon SW_9_67_25]|nr:MAG: UMP kinase [Halobacteriales archaeon SW_9_67_25]
MKVVVSIGGSVLAPDLSAERVAAYARALESVDEAGNELGVVVGGGRTAREYIGTGRELGANEIELDQLGIAATRLNARLLVAALADSAAPTPPETYEDALGAMRRGEIPVMGGTEAGHTTDAVATALAEYVEADLLVYATSVAGVYDADPAEDPDATAYEQLTVDELVALVGERDLEAGINVPVDLLAAKLLQRAGVRAVVIDGTDPEAVPCAVGGDHDGTDVVPDE